MTDTAPSPEQMRFSDALGELESIVAELEGGQMDLEDSLARYERGVALLRGCQARLTEAEQKVTMLMGELEADEGTSES